MTGESAAIEIGSCVTWSHFGKLTYGTVLAIDKDTVQVSRDRDQDRIWLDKSKVKVMNSAEIREVRKAIAEIDRYLLEAQRPGSTPTIRVDEVKKARYALMCLEELVAGFEMGAPQLWAEFHSKITEES